MAALQQDIVAQVRIAVRALETARQRWRRDCIPAAGRPQPGGRADKFDNGLSTNYQVLEIQEDLAQAELTLIRTYLDYRKANIVTATPLAPCSTSSRSASSIGPARHPNDYWKNIEWLQFDDFAGPAGTRRPQPNRQGAVAAAQLSFPFASRSDCRRNGFGEPAGQSPLASLPIATNPEALEVKRCPLLKNRFSAANAVCSLPAFPPAPDQTSQAGITPSRGRRKRGQGTIARDRRRQPPWTSRCFDSYRGRCSRLSSWSFSSASPTTAWRSCSDLRRRPLASRLIATAGCTACSPALSTAAAARRRPRRPLRVQAGARHRLRDADRRLLRARRRTSFGWLCAALGLIAVGGSIIKPTISGTVTRTTVEGSTRPVGFGLYYMMITPAGSSARSSPPRSATAPSSATCSGVCCGLRPDARTGSVRVPRAGDHDERAAGRAWAGSSPRSSRFSATGASCCCW